ncbi:hypothetical protein EKK58_09985 [Candidatus Dependentiae bacterium]|nr:MAG: hypothetical protein EKK58_09985 [Candidatus Dependentiae bacterium]
MNETTNKLVEALEQSKKRIQEYDKCISLLYGEEKMSGKTLSIIEEALNEYREQEKKNTCWECGNSGFRSIGSRPSQIHCDICKKIEQEKKPKTELVELDEDKIWEMKENKLIEKWNISLIGSIWINEFSFKVKILDFSSDEVWLYYLSNDNKCSWDIDKFIKEYRPLECGD